MKDPAKVWSKKEIVQLISANDEAAIRALNTIYANQNSVEQEKGKTVSKNGVGFTAYDATVLSNIARFYRRTGFVTSDQLSVVRQRIVKYWRQLLDAAKSNGRQVQYK